MKTKIKKLMLTIVLVLGAVVLSPAQIVYKKTLRTDGGDISITDCAVNKEPYSNSDLQKTRILAKNGTEFAITFPESYQNLSIVRRNTNIVIEGRKIRVKEPGFTIFGYTYTENGVSYTCDFSGDVNYYGELSYNGKSDLQANPIEVKTTNENDKLVVPNVFPAKGWGFRKSNVQIPPRDLTELGVWEETVFSEDREISLNELLRVGVEKGQLRNNKLEIVLEFGDITANTLMNGIPGGTSFQIITLIDARTYNLNLSQEGQGTVSVSKSQLKTGESATLTAQAAQGWRFDHWEENAQNLGTTNPLTVTMGTQDRSIKAVFKEIPKVVTLQIVDTKGQKLADPEAQEVTSGGTVTFQVPNLANVNFKGWKRNGQIVETGNTYTLSNVTQNETIQAVFEVPVQSLSLSFTELNLKVGESKPLPSVTVVPSNANDQTIAWVSNNPGIAKIENGKVVGVSAGPVNLVASSSNQKKATLKVVVQAVKHTVTVQLVAEGTSQSLGTKSYEVEQGKTVTLKATELGAEAKYEFVKWDRNGTVSSEQSISFVVNSSETLKAIFKEKVVQAVKHTVTVELVAEGTSQSLGTKSYEVEQGKTVTLKATELGAEAKYEFVKWDRNGVLSSEQSISFVVNSSETLKAIFKEKVVQAVKHTVTVELVAEGTSQSLGTKNYEVEQGKTVTVKASELGAEAKYEFVKWDRNGTVSSEQSISFVVNSSETLKAFFKEKVVQAVKHTVTVQLVAEGTSQSLGTKSYEVVVWENFPQGVDKSAIKYSLRDFNGVDISNNKQIFEVNGQNLIFKKIGSYFLIATLRDNQNNEIRIDFTIQVNE